MTSDLQFLALYLDAPLQSWGYQSRFDRRTSLSHPTRSGITGMICAAMGIDRYDTQALEQLADLEMTVLVFQQHGRLIDFHTVGGGWDKKTASLNIVQTAQGSVGSTVVTRREYLQWAKFGAVIKGQTEQLTQIMDALLNPCWGIWLGRKSCIPATPVCQGQFKSFDDAVMHLASLSGSPVERMVEEVSRFEDGCDTINDMPLNYAERLYAPRRIRM